MAVSVTIGEPTAGLELMSPTAPSFDSTIRSLFRGSADDLLKLKPFLTILSNCSDRTLVAYTLKWEVDQRGSRRITQAQHKYPDALSPSVPQRGNEVRPGEHKIVAMGIEVDCGRWGNNATEELYLRQSADWFSEYNDARALDISLDAAIFDNGELGGPNESKLDQDFGAYVDAKQKLLHEIVHALDSGLSLDEALAPVEAAIKADAHGRLLHFRNLRRTWQRVAAPEVRSWRLKYGDKAATEFYRLAIRSEPFVIRGSASPEAENKEQVLSHVFCPRCHASPKSTDRWNCNCGHRWNTFDTCGLCPACGYQWNETACPECGEISPHADWYTGDKP